MGVEVVCGDTGGGGGDGVGCVQEVLYLVYLVFERGTLPTPAPYLVIVGRICW